MAWTSVLGSADSVLGLSMRLGAATESGGGSSLEVAATNTIAASQEATAFNGNVIAESVIGVAQDVAVTLVQFTVAAENAISLSHAAAGTAGSLSNSEISSLALVQTATGVLRANHVKSLVSTLTISQTVSHNQRITAATSTLTVSHTASQNGPLPRSAESELDLQQEAYVPQTFTEGASTSLSLSQAVGQFGPRPVSATSTLSVVQSVDATPDKERDATSTLTVSAVASADLAKNVVTALSLSQVAVGFATQRLENVISLTQIVNVTRPIYVDAESALVEYEDVFDPTTLSYSTVETGLTSEASAAILAVPSVHHYIQWTSVANGYADRVDGITADAESVLAITDEARISNPQDAENVLSLSQVASAQVSQENPESELSLSQTASSSIIRAAIAAETAISVQQAVRFVLQQTSTVCDYSPFVGSTTDADAPEPPSTSLPVASELTGFRLLYPSTGTPTEEVVLRAPNLGNIDRLSFDRINRETRGGTLVVYADPIWPKVETLLLTFSVLTREEADALLAFMLATIGKEIRLIDWENRGWTGVIINPQDPIVEDRRNSFTASFEFEGERQGVSSLEYSASSALSMSQTAGGLTNQLAANSVLAIASAASQARNRNVDSASAISLSQSSTESRALPGAVASSLTLGSQAGASLGNGREISTALTLSSVASQVAIRPAAASSDLSLASTVGGTLSGVQGAASSLSLSSIATKTVDRVGAANSALVLSSVASQDAVRNGAAASTLTLSSVASQTTNHAVGASSTATLASAGGQTSVRDRSASSAISLASTSGAMNNISPTSISTLSLTSLASQTTSRPASEISELMIGSEASCEYLHPLRTGDAEILTTGDGDPLEAS